MNFAQLGDVVKDQGGFDVARTMIDGWVNEVYKEVVAASGWLVATAPMDTTVADQQAYPMPDTIVEVEALRIGTSSSYDRVTTTEMWALESGDAVVSGGKPVFSQDFDEDGNRVVKLWPVPDTSGDTIIARASRIPSDLAGTQVPIIPTDMHGRLAAGSIALGRARIDEREDQASYYEQKVAEAATALRLRRRSQVAGEGDRLAIEFVDFNVS
jgi:hypothetical protein